MRSACISLSTRKKALVSLRSAIVPCPTEGLALSSKPRLFPLSSFLTSLPSDNHVVLCLVVEQTDPCWALSPASFLTSLPSDNHVVLRWLVEPRLFPCKLSVWQPCGTVVTGRMHDDLFLIQHSRDIQENVGADLAKAWRVPHVLWPTWDTTFLILLAHKGHYSWRVPHVLWPTRDTTLQILLTHKGHYSWRWACHGMACPPRPVAHNKGHYSWRWDCQGMAFLACPVAHKGHNSWRWNRPGMARPPRPVAHNKGHNSWRWSRQGMARPPCPVAHNKGHYSPSGDPMQRVCPVILSKCDLILSAASWCSEMSTLSSSLGLASYRAKLIILRDRVLWSDRVLWPCCR